MKKENNVASGIGFFQILTLVFIVLKLTGHIEWRWLWVLSPLWIPVSSMLAVLIITAVIVFISLLFSEK